MLIGLSGKARVGKDTIGDYLVTHHGFERLSFAYYLKSLATKVFGWDGIKDHRGRALLQDLGTVVRNYDSVFWLRPVIDYVVTRPQKSIVITDVRHINEADAIINLGGSVIRVNRSTNGLGELSSHISEVALDTYKEFDLILDNSGGFDELYKKVDEFLLPKLTTVS